MKQKILLLVGMISLIFTVSGYAGQSFRRYAFLVGANNGGVGRVTLKYAMSDAYSIAAVFKELGGIAPKDIVILESPNPFVLQAEMESLKRKVRETKKFVDRVEVIVYYSGHSDEQGLLLAEKQVKYKNFRKMIDAIPADVRIAILDSCSSGAVTRTKGGKKLPPFLMDTSTSMKGYAFLTSSSATEASQESDKIQGSFFTHYLVSGMRGAADANQDGRVTLNETYQFAFDETLARTESTVGGPQHPGYDIQMNGSGDVVLTDIRKNTASVIFANDVYGRIFVRNSDNKLVAELNKNQGKTVRLGLEEGKYSITVARSGKLYKATVVLKKGAEKNITPQQLRKTQGLYAVSKGNVITTTTTTTTTTTIEEDEDVIATNNTELVVKPKIAPKMRIIIEGKNLSDYIKMKIDTGLRKHKDKEMRKLARHKDKEMRKLARHEDKNMRKLERHEDKEMERHNRRKRMTSLGLYPLVGHVDILNGFGIAMIGINVNEKANGFLMSFVYNHVGYKSSGMMLAFGFNTTEGIANGMQLSVGFNKAKTGMNGVQITTGFNIAGMKMNGLQIASGFNSATGNMGGLQIAGGANFAEGNYRGLQIAGGLNISEGNLLGLQIAGGVNISSGTLDGLQIAVVNRAKQISGGQIGVINIGKQVNGVQIGLINISEHIDGIPIGLISISKDGQNHILSWVDEALFTQIGFSFGTKYIYSMIYTGIKEDAMNMNIGFGMGLHIPLTKNEKLFVNMEGMFETIIPTDGSAEFWWQEDGMATMARARLSVGVQILKRLAIVAGVSYNVYMPSNVDIYSPEATGYVPAIKPLIGQVAQWENYDYTSWPGIFIGVQLF